MLKELPLILEKTSENKESKDSIPEQILVPKEEEQAYLRKHKMEYEVLPNGIRILRAHRLVPDSVQSSLTLSFRGGAYHDPQGKEGLTHLLEHLFGKKVLNESHPYGVETNAATLLLEVKQYADGPINLAVSDYGILPLLPKIRDALTSLPFNDPDFIHSIEGEKKAILAEKIENDGNHNKLVQRFMRKTVFASDNPVQTDIIGDAKSLQNITIDDLKTWSKKTLVPQHLAISLFTEGKKDVGKKAVEDIKDLFSVFPQEHSHITDQPYDLLKKMNNDFIMGQRYEEKTALNNNLVSIVLAWPYKTQPYTPNEYALSYLSDIMEEKLFDISRTKGWSYNSTASIITGDLSSGVLYVRVDVPKMSAEEMEQFLHNFNDTMQHDIINKLTSGEDEKILERVKKEKNASPISVKGRLAFAVNGIKRWGRIIDADKMRNISEQITMNNLAYWKDTLLTQKPSLFLVGDLPEKAEKSE